MVSENTPKIVSIGPLIMEKRPFKKTKIFSSLSPFICKTKIADTLNFLLLKYFCWHLSFLKIWHVSFNYCWNYGLLNLIFRFTRYSSQQLNNTQRERAVNLLIHFLKGTINSSVWWKFQVFWPMDHKMTNLFAKFNGKNILLTVFAKFTEYQSKVLTEMPDFG